MKVLFKNIIKWLFKNELQSEGNGTKNENESSFTSDV